MHRARHSDPPATTARGAAAAIGARQVSGPIVVVDAAELAQLVRDAVASAAGDELVPLASCGLEARAVAALVASGELPVRKIGRRRYTTKRALAALVTSSSPSVALGDSDGEWRARVAARRVAK
jgi:hypothetical protein